MKFTFENELMKKALMMAQDVIDVKNPAAILSNIKLMAYEGKLIIQANNSLLRMATSFPVEIEETGETTVYCDKLYAIVSNLQNGMVSFEKGASDVEAVIKPEGKKIRFKLRTMTTEKYPYVEELEAVEFNRFNVKEFKYSVNKVSFAVSNDNARYFMTGVYFEKKDDRINYVATDGRRLSKSSNECLFEFPNVIVPVKFIDFVTKYGPNEGEVKIGVTMKRIYASFDGVEVSSALIDGQYPAYERVIPGTQKYTVTIPKSSLMDAVRRCELMTDKKVGKIIFDFTKNSLSLKGDYELGSSFEELDIDYDGEDMTIAVNYNYIVDVLKHFEYDSIVMQFTESMKAVTITSKENGGFLHVIMPMQK